ncbi:MAG: porin family protein [Gammaproteobacteria bacterium]|nr:porin family protein [Gammaproteobacteria bacterium]
MFSGAAVAGSYTADAGYTAADTAAMADSQANYLDGLYVGVGINHSADDKSTNEFAGVTTSKLDTSNYGWGFLVGRNITDMFAMEVAYNSFGKNTFSDGNGDETSSYYQMWDTAISGVVNSPVFFGVSGHAKLGAAYLSEKSKEGNLTSSSATTTLVYGLGVQYAIDQFAVSFDWTRFENNDNQSQTSSSMYVPDQFSLNLIYSFA